MPAARPGEAAGNRAPLPGSTRVAGRAAATGRPVRRWLPIALTAVGIVCAGLIIGALAARRHPAPTGSGAATRSTGTRSAGTAGLPAGYRWYSSPAGGPAAFSVAVPQGWQVVQRGVVHLVRDPATGASVKLAALPAGTSLIGQISLLAQRASHDPGYQRIAIVPGFSSLRLRFSFRRHGVGLMAGMDVVARFGPLGARQTEEFLLSTPAGNSGPAGLALAEMLRTFQPQA